MNTQITRTIAAIATPQGRGGIGVIRLSGSAAGTIASQLTGKPLPKPRSAQFSVFLDVQGQAIDEGLVLYFPAPHSFTGEDVIELQGHGGVVVQNMLLARLYALGATAAQAGEFSARAFENGKLDLAQAEAIADLIDASSQAAARSALRSLQGEFSARVNQVLQQLIHLRLHVEAAIDFPEEEIDFLADGKILGLLNQVQGAVTAVQQSAKQGQLLREGLQVVIAGKPNAGKSSLLNALAGVDRAIVTDIAGTTRDVLHEKITLNGLPITLTDTAGLRETQDVVEREGIRRAYQAIEQADLLLLVYDLTSEPDPLRLAAEFFSGHMQPQRLMLIGNKCDLAGQAADVDMLEGYRCVRLSAKHQQGLEGLIHAISAHAGYQPAESTFIARTRHLDALLHCQSHLADARMQLVEFAAGELMAESLRLGQLALSEITGEFTADDLLGQIFGSFCIGK
ncbi:MAG: tRNA uridine-5-carboxymethylaminomethyl(34) synthesis GTPase MnmE [Moraxellaceae bacterium]